MRNFCTERKVSVENRTKAIGHQIEFGPTTRTTSSSLHTVGGMAPPPPRFGQKVPLLTNDSEDRNSALPRVYVSVCDRFPTDSGDIQSGVRPSLFIQGDSSKKIDLYSRFPRFFPPCERNHNFDSRCLSHSFSTDSRPQASGFSRRQLEAQNSVCFRTPNFVFTLPLRAGQIIRHGSHGAIADATESLGYQVLYSLAYQVSSTT
ncbi:hypothetical protein SISNIDRAFT_232521 [Sistotremastrum niveocremeum HHB9708]|uniref:Uncharacterized protein n=1 Tax=Sistotremastrum niveocremeum HHB9708 TaxID=1314777 RepID=A0A164Q1B0_9AGAM|nr:hypothetical protein SISNIDRAFT_232521 [Sistotremastrum niveocremeum HHB9708]